MSRVENHTVPELSDKERLSDYAVGKFSNITSRKGIKKAIKKGWITINNKIGQSGDYLYGGETIILDIRETHKPILELELPILFEDDHLAVVNKPAGITVSGNKAQTIEHALPYNLQTSSAIDALVYPQIAHRLDHPTSGALLIGKTRSAIKVLNKMFQNRSIQKSYYAICIGKLQENRTITSAVDGKASKTTFKMIHRQLSDRFGYLNLVQLTPHTGRRHQLRKHLAALGCPILGDKEYGIEGKVLMGKGLFLHASSLEFKHPITSEQMHITAQLPRKFVRLFPDAFTN